MFIIGVIFGIVLTLGFGKFCADKHLQKLLEDMDDDERTGQNS